MLPLELSSQDCQSNIPYTIIIVGMNEYINVREREREREEINIDKCLKIQQKQLTLTTLATTTTVNMCMHIQIFKNIKLKERGK